MARASSLALFRRCLRAARRCPERDQRLMMTYYTINSWRDGASLRDERAIRRQLADALDQVERMEYLLASKAAAVGSPSAASAALTAPAASAASPPARAVAAAPKAAAAASAVDLDDWLAKHELTRYRAAILEQAAEVRERAIAACVCVARVLSGARDSRAVSIRSSPTFERSLRRTSTTSSRATAFHRSPRAGSPARSQPRVRP